MGKKLNVLSSLVSVGCLTAASMMMLKKRKNMLDVLIEEIETVNNHK